MTIRSVAFSPQHRTYLGTTFSGVSTPVVQLQDGRWVQADPQFYSQPYLASDGRYYVTHNNTRDQVLASLFPSYGHLSGQSTFSTGARPAASTGFFTQSRTGWVQIYLTMPHSVPGKANAGTQVSWKWDSAHMNEANTVYDYFTRRGLTVSGKSDANPMKGSWPYNFTLQQLQRDYGL